MVNEVNKSGNDKAALSQRLAASNRQLQEMQEEHRQLLLEMETLRQRATELTRLNTLQNIQHQRRQQALAMEQRQSIDKSSPSQEASTPSTPPPTPTTTEIDSAAQPIEVKSSAENANTATDAPSALPVADGETSKAENPSEEDKQTASYLQEKLAEIARLKTQYKRVQNMIDTTNMIEQHMTRTDSKSNTDIEQTKEQEISQAQTPVTPVTVEVNSTDVTGVRARDENEELLGTMLNMFSEFTADLRGQADSLKAERDRIKALKEDILKRRQEKK